MQPILFFDSGLGGLTILREARLKLPEMPFIYVADRAKFPYGTQEATTLKTYIIELFSKLLERFNPALSILACNTASTLVLEDLRKIYPQYNFVGTVPAIKPAAAYSQSKMFTVLATERTVKQAYLKNLIHCHAPNYTVNLVGSAKLASIAEAYLHGDVICEAEIKQEIQPCFVSVNNKKTDIIVLGCTHYPFLVNHFRKNAPWPVDWLDSAEGVANRIKKILQESGCLNKHNSQNENACFDRAYFTGTEIPKTTQRVLQAFGLSPVAEPLK